MNLEEIRQKEESFHRTETALRDEHLLYTEKVKKYTDDYRKFVKEVHKEGYVWGLSGWKKVEN